LRLAAPRLCALALEKSPPTLADNKQRRKKTLNAKTRRREGAKILPINFGCARPVRSPFAVDIAGQPWLSSVVCFERMRTWTDIELYFGVLFVFLAIISTVLWRMLQGGEQKRFIIVSELISGETTSPRAKRVLFPLFLISFFDFISATVRWGLTGFSGLTTVTPDGAGYVAVEHGHTFHITSGEFWLGRIQALIFIVCFVVWFLARAYFFHTGDLKRDKPAA
jgi:hypothetical protein